MDVDGKIFDTEISSTGNEIKFCESCNIESLKTPANGICRECNENMCSKCFQVHLKAKPCRHHVFVSQDECSSLSLGGGSKDVTKCEKHDNEVIKFYCRSHDVVGCSDCIVLEHISCKPEYIKDLAKTFVDGYMYKAIVKRVEDLEDRKINNAIYCKYWKNELQTMNEKTLKEILRFRAEINKCLDVAEAKLLSKLQKLTQENTETHIKIEKTLQALSSELEKVKQSIDTQLHRENALFINAMNCKSKLHDMEKMLEKKEQDGVLKSFEFVRNERMSGLLQSAEPLGKLKIDASKKKMKQNKFVVGVRVRRGPDWQSFYGNQDGGGPGTLIAFKENGRAWVTWDNGNFYNYRIGQNNAYDIEII